VIIVSSPSTTVSGDEVKGTAIPPFIVASKVHYSK